LGGFRHIVIKAANHLAPDGRLALVLPAELPSVTYTQDVRRFLLRRFGRAGFWGR